MEKWDWELDYYDEVDIRKLEKERSNAKEDEFSELKSTDLTDEIIADLEEDDTDINISEYMNDSRKDWLPKEKKEKIILAKPVKVHIGNDLHNLTKQKLDKDSDLSEDDYKYAKETYENIKNTSPLINELTDEAIISKDGVTLSEWLYNRRRKRTKKTIQENLINNIKGNVPEYEQSHYVRRVKKEREDLERRKKKVKIRGGDFVELHKKKNTIENKIKKSLGITTQELTDLLAPNSVLTEKEKALILSSGMFGLEEVHNAKDNKKGFYTLGDIQILHYLEKFTLATSKNISIAICKSFTSTTNQLMKMKNMGLIRPVQFIGSAVIWANTKLGMSVIGSKKDFYAKKVAKPTELAERLIVNYVAALLWNNRVNALALDDFPYYGRPINGQIVRGENIITESEIFGSWQREKQVLTKGFVRSSYYGEQFKMVREKWEIEWRKWENKGRPQASPEVLENNEYLYMLSPTEEIGKSFVLPDLVVARPRLEDGTPKNIAIEVEMTIKSIRELTKKLLSYKEDTRIYEKVVYITPHKRVVDNLKIAAKNIDFDRFDVLPFFSPEGEVSNGITPWDM